MPDKEKRKSNPRRRLLIRLIIGIAIFGAVIAIGIDALRPTGAQIVFIAPDDNGVNNIWIADLNDPENPRQLTTVTDNPVSYRQSLSYFQIGDNGNLLFWIKNEDNSQDLYLFEKNTHETRQLMTCDRTYAGCTLQTHVLSPDGRYIAYEQTLEEPIHHVFTANLMLYDTWTEEHQLIYEHDRYNVFSCSVCPQWIGNGDILSYRTNHGEGDFTFYDVEQREIVAEYTLGTIYFKPFFSNDGDLYLYHDETSASDMPNFAMYVHSTFSSENSIFTFPLIEPESEFNITYSNFYDWHPDNERLLIVESWQQGNYEETIDELNLYNVLTGEHQTILSNSRGRLYSPAQFNAEGSQIIYRGIQSQLMLYNMESGEETALPLFGHSPQWVSGGR